MKVKTVVFDKDFGCYFAYDMYWLSSLFIYIDRDVFSYFIIYIKNTITDSFDQTIDIDQNTVQYHSILINSTKDMYRSDSWRLRFARAKSAPKSNPKI